MRFNLERVRANVRAAETEDLLDRVTVYRKALEPAAVPVILEELRARGLDAAAIIDHEQSRGEVIATPDGAARQCARCRKPAVVVEWGWHRLWGRIPVFPRVYHHCQEHRRVQDSAESIE